ncbi:Cof-type HAD-IIB family hydrolase [Lacticaseibacillus mingshuiensis]|uniref:Cof-type HAD-IIB family hydrolase n=1 Tax=Lacticaseibacillus mingshuiensis TaxID=2799574 RepID=A0ABW4CLH6_9LACO|nr:Cof-type HAD-IIB family hydrolase [Lacticaseibacillus mingshuiensis]
MTKAIVFFDLDLTLLNDDKQVPPENLAAIKALQANDCLPVICTGRNLWETADLQAQTGITTVVGANGGDLLLEGQHLFQSPIGQPQLTRLLAQAAEDQLPVAMYSDQAVALTFADENTRGNYELVKQPAPVIDPDFATTQPVPMVLLFTPRTPTGIETGARYVRAFPELTFYRNGPFALDVVNKGMSKGFGVDMVRQQPQFADVKTYAFGDGNNDIAMFEQVDIAVAMGNALPHVAAIADYQTDDYQHAGIPNALKHFGLI